MVDNTVIDGANAYGNLRLGGVIIEKREVPYSNNIQYGTNISVLVEG